MGKTKGKGSGTRQSPLELAEVEHLPRNNRMRAR